MKLRLEGGNPEEHIEHTIILGEGDILVVRAPENWAQEQVQDILDTVGEVLSSDEHKILGIPSAVEFQVIKRDVGTTEGLEDF